MLKNVLCRVVAVLAALVLTACATQGERREIPLTMPGGERATIIAHDQSVPDWMLDRETLKLNYIAKGEVTAKQLAAVMEAERACRIYTGVVRPSNLVAVLANGALWATSGFVGLGLASGAFPRAVQSEYAEYGGVAGAFSGMAGGIVSTGGKVYTFENCGAEVFHLFPGYVRVLRK